jgi:cell division protease FtsH
MTSTPSLLAVLLVIQPDFAGDQMDINTWLAAHRIDPATLDSQPVVDIGGIQSELESIAQRFEHPEIVAAAGASLPRGVLLMGPAGVGKTTWARWLAKRLAGMDLYEVGPEELTADRIRDAFAVLRDKRSILFIEDVDLFGLDRSKFGATDRSGGVTKALLGAMDGLVGSPWPLVIGATTAYKVFLEPALIRAGRLGIHITLEVPQTGERLYLLRAFASSRAIASDVDWDAIAELTAGWTPADLRQALDDAFGVAVAGGRLIVEAADIKTAFGRRGAIEPTTEAWDPWRTAVHESGHVAVALALEGPKFIRSVSIKPSGGMTKTGEDGQAMADLPADRVRSMFAVAYGGLEAEKAVLGNGTLGALDDVRTATHDIEVFIACGLEDGFPPIDLHEIKHMASERLKSLHSVAVTRIADQARDTATAIVAANRGSIETFANQLVERSDLSGRELSRALEAAGFRTLGDDKTTGPIARPVRLTDDQS